MKSKLFIPSVIIAAVALILFASFSAYPEETADTAAAKENNGETTSADAETELLQMLENELMDIASVWAEFVQEKQLPVLERTMVIKGFMALEGTDNIAWHVEEPVRYRMIIHGSRFRQWDEDTDRVQRLNLDQNPAYSAMFQQLTAWFSGRYEKMLEHYDLKIESMEPPVLTFTPLPDTTFEDIISGVTIVFREDARYIEKLEIREVNESISTISFHNTRLNEEIDESVWKARPPE